MNLISAGTRRCFLAVGIFCLVVGSSLPAPAVSTQQTIEVGLLGCSGYRNSAEWIMDEIASFMAAHPDIKVEVRDLGGERKDRELERLAVLPRNVIGICALPGHETAYLARRQDIVPIESFLPDPEFDLDAFTDNLWEPVRYGGKTWGVPWATKAPVLIWSESMFKAAGIDKPPETWEELMEYARLLTKDTNGDGTINQVGIPPLRRSFLTQLALQIALEMNVDLLTDAGYRKYDESVAQVLAKTRRIAMLANELNAGAAREAVYAMGFTTTSTRELDAYAQLPGVRLAPMPNCGLNHEYRNSGGLFLAVRKSTPEEQAASWKFIKWISRKDVSLPSGLYGYPVRKDIIDREDFKAFSKQWYQSAHVAWEANARLADFGSRSVVGRYRGFQELLLSVQAGLVAEDAARAAWDSTAEKLNSNLVVLPELDQSRYELFR